MESFIKQDEAYVHKERKQCRDIFSLKGKTPLNIKKGGSLCFSHHGQQVDLVSAQGGEG